jgi:glycosyltransferase involved in cell wall biosynthesis
LKVVLLHDWLVGFRGGERVLEVFCEMFPKAPLYTLVYKKGSTSSVIENRKIETSFLNSLPGIEKHYRKALPLFPLAADLLKIREDADLIISSSHCVIKGVKKPKGSKHFSYVHSPMRYMYDLFDDYFGEDAPILQRIGARICRPYLQGWDRKSNDNIDLMVGNSDFVKERIKKYYGFNANVIHPFVDLVDFKKNQKQEITKKDFYLCVSAFAPNKRIDLAVEAFNKMGLTLKIVGGGQQESYLKSIAGDNIEFLGNVDRESVIELFKEAKAFIFPGVEDFGITPLESLASGTPVIARKIGGVLETLNDDVAEFFIEDSVEELIDAITRFESRSFDKNTLYGRANDFSKEIFIKKIENEISELMNR